MGNVAGKMKVSTMLSAKQASVLYLVGLHFPIHTSRVGMLHDSQLLFTFPKTTEHYYVEYDN